MDGGPSSAGPDGAHRVRVELGARGYDILIGRGLVEHLGALLAPLDPAPACAVVTDETVARLALPGVVAGLARAGLEPTPVTVPPGEGSKSFAQFAQVADAILAARVERRGLVVALGGGVVGDLAGFAAASVRRGVRIVQVPTTLLAQVDSSVGGKTGINSRHGKNLVGAFHQPSLVVADTALLDTLPPREMRAGYAEIIKTALIDDPVFFERLERDRAEIFAGGPAREAAVAACCRAKAGIVARDETEDGERALLNLGHTFGHALERAAGYDPARLVHGEAVAVGLCLALRFSHRLGLCPGQDVERAVRHIEAAGLPTSLSAVPAEPGALGPDALVDAMLQDKKVVRGALTFILLRGIGRAFVARDVAIDALRAFLRDEAGLADAPRSPPAP